MLVKVFVLGRPGSGKTTAIQALSTLARQRDYTAHCIDDYNILSRMSQADRQHKQFRVTDYGGFDVLDPSVFDTALKILETQARTVLATEKDGLVTIEFARNDYYQALRNFSPAFLQDAYIFFVEADLPTCMRRIRERATKAGQHFISDYAMHRYYGRDNWSYEIANLKKHYHISKTITTCYNTGSRRRLIEAVEDFAEHMFRQEFTGYDCLRRERSGTWSAWRGTLSSRQNVGSTEKERG